MKLIVSTHAKLLALDLDRHYQLANCRVLSTGHHYGIALLPQNTGSKYAFLAKHNDRVLTRYEGGSNFVVSDSVKFAGHVGYVHQIAYVNGGIYIANTERNSVVFQGLSVDVYHEYHFYGKHDDFNHVNSVFPCGESVAVLLHNRGRAPSEIIVLDHARNRGFVPKKRIELKHWGCHNVFFDAGHLYYNASQDGRFVVVDLHSKRIVRTLRFPGHTKGLAASDTLLIIGYSEHAVREARASTKGYLAVVDRMSLDVLAIVDLNIEAPTGNVNEIRLLSPPDQAHVGRRCAAGMLESFSLASRFPLHPHLMRWSRRLRRVKRVGS
ncbi:MAG: hypothetical protein D6791_04550 [Chloroflexi bacterium]|nr:MAG: hypothetical protein D6791_04550 [Chloroflexota bacterium]